MHTEKRVVQIQSLSEFSLVRFQPADIILMHRGSRRPYRYYQLNQQINLLPQIWHSGLQRPILYKNGALYPKGDSTLRIQLQKKRRAFSPSYFSIEQICNTFSPVLECIEFLHSKGIVHGSLSSDSILFFDNGDIFLKDWIYREEGNPFYQQSSGHLYSKADDLKALGLIVAQSACLMDVSELQKMSVEEVIIELLDRYPASFCYSLIILLRGLHRQIHLVPSLMSNDEKSVRDPEILALFEKAQQLKLEREQKAQALKQEEIHLKSLKEQQVKKMEPNLKKEPISQSASPNLLTVGSIQTSPNKKFNVKRHNGNGIKLEDCENKKMFNEEVKKKQIEKITKIIQRSNAFVNELMARKNNDKKLIKSHAVPDPCTGAENAVRKVLLKNSPKIGSPSKRLRSINKKK